MAYSINTFDDDTELQASDDFQETTVIDDFVTGLSSSEHPIRSSNTVPDSPYHQAHLFALYRTSSDSTILSSNGMNGPMSASSLQDATDGRLWYGPDPYIFTPRTPLLETVSPMPDAANFDQAQNYILPDQHDNNFSSTPVSHLNCDQGNPEFAASPKKCLLLHFIIAL